MSPWFHCFATWPREHVLRARAASRLYLRSEEKAFFHEFYLYYHLTSFMSLPSRNNIGYYSNFEGTNTVFYIQG